MSTLHNAVLAFLNLAFVVVNFTFWFTVGSPVSLLFAGFHLGLVLWVVTDWWVDHKFNKEIMEEIHALSRNYDNQMSLFNENNFPENNNNTEVTKND